jgi:carbon monoxide dehydrogenase subunit G
MELSNDFRVGVPIEQAWAVLTDVERIAPCLPGAELQEIAGEQYRGIVKVKVGPITAQYKGQAQFVEKDDVAHRAVLRAEGRDTRGQGNANATITATLEPDGDGTAVRVVTDLTVTGKVAQFGRGVLADVSAKLLGQFVECLEKDVLAGAVAGAAAASAAATATAAEPASVNGQASGDHDREPRPEPASQAEPAARPEPSPEEQASVPEPDVRTLQSQPATPVDLLDAAGVPVAKRAIPIVAGVLVILWFLRRRARNRA